MDTDGAGVTVVDDDPNRRPLTRTERDPATEAAQVVHHHGLRMRTVAVSFAAAVSSARHDLANGAAERDAQIELWRHWSLQQLNGYGADFDALLAERPDLVDAVTALRLALADSVDTVRRA